MRMRSRGAATTAAANRAISRQAWTSASSIRKLAPASRAFSRSADARPNDADRASLHRRGRPGAELRPRRTEVLRQPTRAVGGDPEARGGAGRVAVRAGKDRSHGNGGRGGARRTEAEKEGR